MFGYISGRVYSIKRNNTTIAIIRIEQLYPFPKEELKAELLKYPNAKDVVWCQEEPKNQGAWLFIRAPIENCLQPNQVLRYVGRPEAASTAAGYKKLHEQQREQLLTEAFL